MGIVPGNANIPGLARVGEGRRVGCMYVRRYEVQ